MTKFSDIVKVSGAEKYIIKTYDEYKKTFWFLLEAKDIDIRKLKHTSSNDIVDLTRYGKILDSGWGHGTPDFL